MLQHYLSVEEVSHLTCVPHGMKKPSTVMSAILMCWIVRTMWGQWHLRVRIAVEIKFENNSGFSRQM
jgi:hypothetical protein